MKIKQTHGSNCRKLLFQQGFLFNHFFLLKISSRRCCSIFNIEFSKSDERTLEVEGKEKVIDSQICKFHARLLIDIRRVRQKGGKWRDEGEDSLSRILRECKGKKGRVTNVLPRRVSGFAEGIGFSNGVNRKFTRESWLSIPRGGTNVCPARRSRSMHPVIQRWKIEKLTIYFAQIKRVAWSSN